MSRSEHVGYSSIGNDISYGVQRDPDGWTVKYARRPRAATRVRAYPLDVDTNEIRELVQAKLDEAKALAYAVECIEQDREERMGDLSTRRRAVLEEAGFMSLSYERAGSALQNMVDRVIELEDRK